MLDFVEDESPNIYVCKSINVLSVPQYLKAYLIVGRRASSPVSVSPQTSSSKNFLKSGITPPNFKTASTMSRESLGIYKKTRLENHQITKKIIQNQNFYNYCCIPFFCFWHVGIVKTELSYRHDGDIHLVLLSEVFFDSSNS